MTPTVAVNGAVVDHLPRVEEDMAVTKKPGIWERLGVLGIFVPILGAIFGAFGAFVATQTLNQAALTRMNEDVQRLEQRVKTSENDVKVERERRFEAEKSISAMRQWMEDHNIKLIVPPSSNVPQGGDSQ